MRGLILLVALALQAPPVPQDDAAIHKEMEELILQVERRQMEIDRALYDASAGGKLSGPVSTSGIAELLRRSRDNGEAVQRDMHRILELAASHVHQGGT